MIQALSGHESPTTDLEIEDMRALGAPEGDILQCVKDDAQPKTIDVLPDLFDGVNWFLSVRMDCLKISTEGFCTGLDFQQVLAEAQLMSRRYTQQDVEVLKKLGRLAAAAINGELREAIPHTYHGDTMPPD